MTARNLIKLQFLNVNPHAGRGDKCTNEVRMHTALICLFGPTRHKLSFFKRFIEDTRKTIPVTLDKQHTHQDTCVLHRTITLFMIIQANISYVLPKPFLCQNLHPRFSTDTKSYFFLLQSFLILASHFQLYVISLLFPHHFSPHHPLTMINLSSLIAHKTKQYTKQLVLLSQVDGISNLLRISP